MNQPAPIRGGPSPTAITQQAIRGQGVCAGGVRGSPSPRRLILTASTRSRYPTIHMQDFAIDERGSGA
jgi:hypothetical protein